MKRINLIIILLLALLILIGCSVKSIEPEGVEQEEKEPETEEVVEEEPEPEELLVWSYTDDFLTEIKAFEEAYNAKLTVEIVEMQGMGPMLGGMVKSGQGLPDVVVIDEDGLHSGQLTEFWMDLADMGLEQSADERLMTYIYESGFDDQGKIIGFGYQATPMAIFYRRSMAREVFGTDDPIDMVPKFADYRQLSQMAVALDASGYKLFPDIYTTRYFTGLHGGWFMEDGTYQVPAEIRYYLELIRELQMEEYVGYLNEWSSPWLEGMYKASAAEGHEEVNVFAYVLPSWALKNVMMLVGPDEEPIRSDEDQDTVIYNPTDGDWAVAEILDPKYMGSSFVGINKDTSHVDLAKAFTEYLVFDEEHQTRWMEESDMISSLIAVQKEQSFAVGDDFLGGQDYHQMFGNIAHQIDYYRLEETWKDGTIEQEEHEKYIEAYLNEVIMKYIQGDYHTIDEALKDLRENGESFRKEVADNEG